MKTENNKQTPLQKRLDSPNSKIPKEQRTDTIRRGLRSVTVAPVAPPRNFYESLVLYRSGATNRLYIYDEVNAEWLYETLTT